jgi:hypothetical protein
VCGRSPAEIVGSNPTGDMDVCLGAVAPKTKNQVAKSSQENGLNEVLHTVLYLQRAGY